MRTELKFGTAGLDWNDVCSIFERAPLGTRKPDKLRRASENSYAVCTAWQGDALVGFGRAISDGEYQSAIYDVVILPEVQGQGIGRTIMQALLDRLPDRTTVLIYAVPGKEGFYEKLDFGLLKTGMALFPDPERAHAAGYLY